MDNETYTTEPERLRLAELEVLMMKKVGFKDLSGWVKLSVIMGWLYAATIGIYFVIGLIEGAIG